ncbi:MAG: M1 family aminopeptidase [Dehalococcoidia bacterium]
MSDATIEILGGFEACHGLTQMAAAPGDRAFALPGDEAVWGRDRPFIVEHLRIELEPDVQRRSVRGVATTTFRPRNDGLREAVFDAIELNVESVTDEAGKPFAFRTGDRTLTIDLGRARPSTRPITTVVTYTASPRRGLYFNAPDEGYPNRPVQVWTQGQAEDSACYFPCFDFPGEKFTTEMLATVPASWFALSNGRLVEVTENRRRRTKTYHWAQEIPHPAYLVTLAAGEFDEVVTHAQIPGGGDVPVQYYGATGTAADLERAFGRTPEMVRFFSDKIGVDYPWAKYATVAVADFIFGGMENTSATTMTDTLLHDDRAHEDVTEQCDSITAHELAHQWFGDLLTCREWSHGWLNESFATYFDALFVEHHRGHDAFRYDVSQKASHYFEEDRRDYRRSIVENIYREPIDIFDRHLYERGSVVLDMLRTELGDELWWKAINHYVTRHRAGDVLTHDLQRAIEQATGRNMDAFFQQWVWKGGHPEFKASTSWDGASKILTVTLNQTQKAEGLTSIYRVPMEIGLMVNGTFERHVVRVVDAAHAFLFKLAAEPAFVAIDPAGRVLKTLDYAPGETPLKARLTGDPEAVGRIEAAKALAKVGSPGAIEALRAALRNRREIDFVRAEIASALGGAKSDAARDALIGSAGDASARVRRAIASALGNFRDPQAAATLRGYLDGTGRNPGDASYYVQANAAAALGRTLDGTAFEALRKVLGRPAHNDAITAGALTGLGALRDPRALPLLLDHTKWGVHQNSRRAATAALGALAPYLDDLGRTRLRERLEELLDDRWLRVQIAAIAAVEAVGDAKSIPALGAAAGRSLEGRVKRSSRVAIRRIGEAQDRSAEVRGLKDEVEKLQQTNQKLADRMSALEARLPAPSPRRRG